MTTKQLLQFCTELSLAFLILNLRGNFQGVEADQDDEKIDAALTNGGSTLMFKDGLLMFLRHADAEQVATLEDMGIALPADFKLQATWMQKDPTAYFFYGPNYALKFTPEDGKMKRLRYGRRRQFIREGGPDAAGFMDGKLYFFKGCEVAQRKNWHTWTRQQNVTDLGLPCDVDAAWEQYNDPGVLNVLKDSQVWKWKPSGVEGPVALDSVVTLRPWVVNTS